MNDRILAEVIDERVEVVGARMTTQYLLRPVGVDGHCGVWVDVTDIRPEDLEPISRKSLCDC